MGKTRLTNDHENLVKGGPTRWHGSQKIFYQVFNYGLEVPPLSGLPSFSALSQVFPLGFNIYEDDDSKIFISLIIHSWNHTYLC